MAKINFPDTSANNPSTGAPWADGDTTNITADNVTITYEFKKPASPNTDSWWKSMGRVNNATPTDKIEEGDSSVEVIDTGANSGQVVVTTDGTARAKFRTDGHFVVGGNLDSGPNVELTDDGKGHFKDHVFVGNEIDSGVGFNAYQEGLLQIRNDTNAQNPLVIYNGGNATANARFAVDATGKTKIGGDPIGGKGGNIELNNDGSSLFKGSLEIEEDTSPWIKVGYGTSGAAEHRIQWDSAGILINADPTKSVANSRISFSVDGTTRATFVDNGSFRIGGTLPNTPNTSLNKDGSADFKGNVKVGDQTNAYANLYSNGQLWLKAGAATITDSTAWIRALRDDGEKFRVDGDGSIEAAGSLQVRKTGDFATKPAFQVYDNGTIHTYRNVSSATSEVVAFHSDVGSARSKVSLITGDGTYQIQTAGGGIKFPASNTGSSDVNTLDDYEEGTWTPKIFDAISGGNEGAFTTASSGGTYIKIGGLVTISCVIVGIDTAGMTGSNQLFIRNIPFTGSFINNNAEYQGGAQTDSVNLDASAGSLAARIITGATPAVTIIESRDSLPRASLTVGAFTTGSNTAEVRFSITYRTAQ